MKKNRITEQEVDAILDAATMEKVVMHGKETLCCFLLPNGFTITGRAACVDPANFNAELGVKIAREDAKRQLWAFEGYRLQCELYEKSSPTNYNGPSRSAFTPFASGRTGLEIELDEANLGGVESVTVGVKSYGVTYFAKARDFSEDFYVKESVSDANLHPKVCEHALRRAKQYKVNVRVQQNRAQPSNREFSILPASTPFAGSWSQTFLEGPAMVTAASNAEPVATAPTLAIQACRGGIPTVCEMTSGECKAVSNERWREILGSGGLHEPRAIVPVGIKEAS